MAGAMEPPVVRHGFASYEKKGEDRWLNCTFAGSAMGLSPNRGESRVSDLHLFAIFGSQRDHTSSLLPNN